MFCSEAVKTFVSLSVVRVWLEAERVCDQVYVSMWSSNPASMRINVDVVNNSKPG